MRFMWIPALLATYFLGEYIESLMPPPEVEAQMAVWWMAIAAAVNAGASIYGAYKGGQAADAQSDAAKRAGGRAGEQLARTDTAISDLKANFGQQSEGQLEYMDRLREQLKSGSLPTGQMISAVSQRTNEQANVAQQRVRGEAYSSGVGGAASASAVGRVQSKALQAIAEQSRAITIENELTKNRASDQLGAIGLAETTARRNLDVNVANLSVGAGAQHVAGVNAADMAAANAQAAKYGAYAQGVSGVANAFGQYADYQSGQSNPPPPARSGFHYETMPDGSLKLVPN